MLLDKVQTITQSITYLPRFGVPILVTMGGFHIKVCGETGGKYELHTDYLEVIYARLDTVPTRAFLLRVFSSLASIGIGASIGKEGPMVQIPA